VVRTLRNDNANGNHQPSADHPMEKPAWWWNRCVMKNLRISAHEEISVPEDWKITTPLNHRLLRMMSNKGFGISILTNLDIRPFLQIIQVNRRANSKGCDRGK